MPNKEVHLFDLGIRLRYEVWNKKSSAFLAYIRVLRIKKIKNKMAKANLQMPTQNGWYWIQIDGYYDGPKWFPCWYEGNGCFLPGGMGDSSSCGIRIDDGIINIGHEIQEPTF